MMQKINELLRKRELFPFYLIALISFLYSLPLLLPGFIQGHDSLVQLASAAARIEALKDGQFPTRWAGDLNFGFGNPSFIFYYSLGGYLISILYFLGFGLETAYEVLLALSLISSSLFFYIFAIQLFKKESAFIGALLYGLSPYVFLDVYVRSHLGESMSLALIPLVLYFIERNLKKANINNIVAGGVAYALLIHSHAILSLIFSVLFAAYILFRCRLRIKSLLLNYSVLAIGLVLSAYFWIPSVVEGKYINSKLFLSEWYKDHFLTFAEAIYAPWGFGSNVNDPGGQSPQVGLIYLVFILFALLFLFEKKSKSGITFWLVALSVGIFMSTDYSRFLYDRFHLLQRFQFPWRFISLGALSSSILAMYFFDHFSSKKIKAIAVVVLLITAIPMAKVPYSKSYGNDYYFNYQASATYHNEATTIWVEGDAFKTPEKEIELIAGEGEIKNIVNKSNLHKIEVVDAKTDIRLLDNTVYFPGWRVLVDGKKTPIEFQDNNHKGLITFGVPRGKHVVEVKFGESLVRLISDIISLLGIAFVIFILIYRKWVNRLLKI